MMGETRMTEFGLMSLKVLGGYNMSFLFNIFVRVGLKFLPPAESICVVSSELR
jgi:hypothetical protein